MEVSVWMKHCGRSLVFLLLAALAACSGDREPEPQQVEKDKKAPEVVEPDPTHAEMVWQLAGFVSPESALYDSERKRIYISSMGGEPLDKDRNGFISVLKESGEVVNMAWLSGLQAPKGMALMGDRLYIADLDEVLEVQVEDVLIANVWPVPDVGFLNDVAAGPDGRIYLSDMSKDRIYVIEDGLLSVWLESPELEGPNGLYATDSGLLVASWGTMTDGFETDVPGHLKRVDYQTRQISSIGSGTALGNLDGLEQDRRGDYLVSDWVTGKVYRIDKTGDTHVLLSLRKGTADLGYIREQDIFLLPLMQHGMVQAYRLAVSSEQP